MSHTPGPWSISVVDAEMIDIRSDTRPPNKIAIAVVGIGFNGPIDDEQHSNATLIAAAPDLLHACETFLSWAERGDDQTPLSDVRVLVRAAIKKARG